MMSKKVNESSDLTVLLTVRIMEKSKGFTNILNMIYEIHEILQGRVKQGFTAKLFKYTLSFYAADFFKIYNYVGKNKVTKGLQAKQSGRNVNSVLTFRGFVFYKVLEHLSVYIMVDFECPLFGEEHYSGPKLTNFQ